MLLDEMDLTHNLDADESAVVQHVVGRGVNQDRPLRVELRRIELVEGVRHVREEEQVIARSEA